MSWRNTQRVTFKNNFSILEIKFHGKREKEKKTRLYTNYKNIHLYIFGRRGRGRGAFIIKKI